MGRSQQQQYYINNSHPPLYLTVVTQFQRAMSLLFSSCPLSQQLTPTAPNPILGIVIRLVGCVSPYRPMRLTSQLHPWGVDVVNTLFLLNLLHTPTYFSYMMLACHPQAQGFLITCRSDVC